jgi:hypothetical protein
MASTHRSRQWLEAIKFAVYVGTPIAVTYVLAFGTQGLLERSIEDRAYVVYPSEGPTPPKMSELQKQGEKLIQRRKRGESNGSGGDANDE